MRDALLGLPLKDFDVEVFGLAPDALREVLAGLGRVNAVGEAFTVYKVSGLAGVERRRGRLAAAARLEGRPGTSGHRGRRATRACRWKRRRAAATSRSTRCSTIRSAGELLDPHGGRADLDGAPAARGGPRAASARIRCARCGPCSSPRASS